MAKRKEKEKKERRKKFQKSKSLKTELTFSSNFFLSESKPSRRSITTAKRKEKEKKERRKKISKIEKPKDVDFSACPSQNVIKRDASGKSGKLSCCKCIFDQIKANLAEIQPENRQNVQKHVFLQKALGVNRLRYSFKTCATV